MSLTQLGRAAFSGRGGSSEEFRAAMEALRDFGEVVSWRVQTEGRRATAWALKQPTGNL